MENKGKPPTINDVARIAGVSKRTVSRVINRSPKVNETTRERVEEVIKTLNFSPNRQARGLAASRSFLLGLIYDVPTLFINDIQKGMLNVCEGKGYELVVHACHVENEGLTDDVMRFMRRAHLDGVIILPPVSDNEDLAQRLQEAGYQFVRFTSRVSGDARNLVVTDYLPAISEMTRHLVELGHRKFGFITGPPSHISSQKRRETFIEVLAGHGLELPERMIAEGAFTYKSGLLAARQLLSDKDRPTAIFAANDEMAFGVMNVANEMGIGIPNDLSVVGFDGTPYSTFVIPSLSTIIRQTDEMARLGTEKLLALIEQGTEAAAEFVTMVSPRFLPRGSSGPVPSNENQ